MTDGGDAGPVDAGDGGLRNITDVERHLCPTPPIKEQCGFTLDQASCPAQPPKAFEACGTASKHQCEYCFTVDGDELTDVWLCGSKGWLEADEYTDEICHTP